MQYDVSTLMKYIFSGSNMLISKSNAFFEIRTRPLKVYFILCAYCMNLLETKKEVSYG